MLKMRAQVSPWEEGKKELCVIARKLRKCVVFGKSQLRYWICLLKEQICEGTLINQWF
jgi:hypothetical protein